MEKAKKQSSTQVRESGESILWYHTPFPTDWDYLWSISLSQISTKDLIVSVDYDCIQLFIYVIFFLIYSESCLMLKRYMYSGLILYDSKLSWKLRLYLISI